MSQSQLWSDLAAKAQTGDKRAYEQLLKDILPFIQNVIRGRLANPDWVDDITQDALMSVHKSLKTYDPKMPFRPWLMAIVSFRRTDYLRKHYRTRDQKQLSSDMAEFQGSSVTNPTHAGEYKDIEAALGELPEKQRKIFQMVKIQGYSIEEVANEMNMNASAVKVSAHRTMKKLQKRLG
ncbi:RNA polymerase sigma factor [Alphaproteobacteria bacterium]|nr:RNA polymerase sigma factor [Alphaproteobacteria bacterium]